MTTTTTYDDALIADVRAEIRARVDTAGGRVALALTCKGELAAADPARLVDDVLQLAEPLVVRGHTGEFAAAHALPDALRRALAARRPDAGLAGWTAASLAAVRNGDLAMMELLAWAPLPEPEMARATLVSAAAHGHMDLYRWLAAKCHHYMDAVDVVFEAFDAALLWSSRPGSMAIALDLWQRHFPLGYRRQQVQWMLTQLAPHQHAAVYDAFATDATWLSMAQELTLRLLADGAVSAFAMKAQLAVRVIATVEQRAIVALGINAQVWTRLAQDGAKPIRKLANQMLGGPAPVATTRTKLPPLEPCTPATWRSFVDGYNIVHAVLRPRNYRRIYADAKALTAWLGPCPLPIPADWDVPAPIRRLFPAH